MGSPTFLSCREVQEPDFSHVSSHGAERTACGPGIRHRRNADATAAGCLVKQVGVWHVGRVC